jgi:hypothetical protein
MGWLDFRFLSFELKARARSTLGGTGDKARQMRLTIFDEDFNVEIHCC